MVDKEKQNQLQEDEEDQPLKEVGPEECGSVPQQCEFCSGDRDDPPHESQFSMMDEIQEAFQAEDIPTFLAEDGLPAFDDCGDYNFAHPFTIDSVICVEDKRVYVEIFREEFNEIHVSPPASHRFKIFTRSRWDEDGNEVIRKTYDPNEVKNLFGIDCVTSKVDNRHLRTILSKYKAILQPVRPIRPRCKYYKRQCFALDGTKPGDSGHNLIFRNCTKRRSVGGAYMSLRDEAVYACEYRDPPHKQSTADVLDYHDDLKLKNRPDLVKVPMFGLDGSKEEDFHNKESK